MCDQCQEIGSGSLAGYCDECYQEIANCLCVDEIATIDTLHHPSDNVTANWLIPTAHYEDVPADDPKVCDPKEMNNPKAPLGAKKIPLGLLSPAGMYHEAAAMENGAAKYGAWNYREVDIKASVYYHAALRHIQLYWDKEEIAPDSGVHHLGHAKACLGIWLDAIQTGNYVDDRPPSSNLGELFKEFEER